MTKYICLHGHFYQPPRENPWTNQIDQQPSAKPFHDWNERITSECYQANAASPIKNEKGEVIHKVNNYARISFNFGPTLLSWMKEHAEETYKAIVEADCMSQVHFSGHGSALAQCYNHMIMPLANQRDKETQVIWGIKDFESHFQRMPEGMWLPETAVDLVSLEVLADHGIKYVILAPGQGHRYKKFTEKKWHNCHSKRFNLNIPYLCRLSNDKTMNIFFYDGSISHDIAFGDLLKNGLNLANRCKSSINHKTSYPEIVHTATDGETFGHHHAFGNMALSYCLSHLQEEKGVALTIYGEFLEKYPPQYEVEIAENTSWSCAHGVERWRSNCSCAIDPGSGWHQKWRRPLREALNWLRDVNIFLYEQELKEICSNPWGLRNDYIDIILDSSDEKANEILSRYITVDFTQGLKEKVLMLLHAQHMAMLMYTSCGWFFDDIGGLEVQQILQYAAKLIQTIRDVCDKDLEPEFLAILQTAPSNDPKIENGKKVYEELIKNLESSRKAKA